jgi:predicted DNA-binding protein
VEHEQGFEALFRGLLSMERERLAKDVLRRGRLGQRQIASRMS